MINAFKLFLPIFAMAFLVISCYRNTSTPDPVEVAYAKDASDEQYVPFESVESNIDEIIRFTPLQDNERFAFSTHIVPTVPGVRYDSQITVFTYVDALEPERMFDEEFMNNPQNNQFYVAIRIFVTGDPETVANQHWVGVNELVTRNVRTTIIDPDTGDTTTTDIPTLFYRISPTSIHDRGNFGNRVHRGWCFWPNATDPQDIYVPLSEVVEYRIFQIPQGE